MTFFHFSQPWPWPLERPAVNEPIAMAEAIDPHVKDKVDLQMKSIPGYHAYCIYRNKCICADH